MQGTSTFVYALNVHICSFFMFTFVTSHTLQPIHQFFFSYFATLSEFNSVSHPPPLTRYSTIFKTLSNLTFISQKCEFFHPDGNLYAPGHGVEIWNRVACLRFTLTRLRLLLYCAVYKKTLSKTLYYSS